MSVIDTLKAHGVATKTDETALAARVIAKVDFNILLLQLKAAGLMAADP